MKLSEVNRWIDSQEWTECTKKVFKYLVLDQIKSNAKLKSKRPIIRINEELQRNHYGQSIDSWANRAEVSSVTFRDTTLLLESLGLLSRFKRGGNGKCIIYTVDIKGLINRIEDK